MSPLPLIVLAFAFLAPSTAAHPVVDMKGIINSTIDAFMPKKGNGTIVDELSCYSLPYGGIGFVGHVLTYWTVLLLICGNRPFMPWKSLEYKKFDLLCDTISLLLAVPLASLTIFRCSGRWQYVLLAVWKTTLAISLSAISFQRSWSLEKDRLRRKGRKLQEKVAKSETDNTEYQPIPNNYDDDGMATSTAETPSLTKEDGPGFKSSLLWWLGLYALGTIVGLVGLFSIVGHEFEYNHTLRTVSWVFLGVTIFIPGIVGGLGLLIFFDKPKPGEKDTRLMTFVGFNMFTFIILVLWAGMLAAFYSDWVLGAIAKSLVGAPTEDNKVFYWTYFVAKRLPMFSL